MAAHAVVIGGSMAGMLAARVLSDYFDRVTIIERDKLPDTPDYRAGVPQARHLHALLAKGHAALVQLFPTLEEDFLRLGIPSISVTQDTATFTAGGWTKRFPGPVTTNPVSRVTLDWYVCQQIRQRPNITFLQHTDAQRLIADEGGQHITGVEITSRDDQSTQTISADLVVDASGRLSKAPQWLQDLGYEASPQTVVNSYMGYATRWYEIPADRAYDWHIILVTALPTRGIKRGGGIQVVEGSRWVVTLGGFNKDYPPTEEEGFLEFARQLASPVIYEAIRNAKPLSPIYGYRRTENAWNHYERLPRHPQGFIVMGDAYCGFNPIYGQGMTVAAMEVQQLDSLLRQVGPDGIQPAAFYQALAKVVETPWLLATGEDLRYPGTDGDRPGPAARMVQKYFDRIIAILPLDEVVAQAFIEVIQLLQPPQIMFRPHIVARVLRHSLRRVPRDDRLNEPLAQVKPAAGD